MSKVWIYPEREWGELSSSRFKVEWYEVRPSAKDKEELDIDADVACFARYCKTKTEALILQRYIYATKETAFGDVGMIEQVVGWFVEEDRVAEWQDVGEMEYIA